MRFGFLKGQLKYPMRFLVRPPALLLDGVGRLDKIFAGLKLHSFASTTEIPTEVFARVLEMHGYDVTYKKFEKDEYTKQVSLISI
jgi:hypothetical protein